MQFNENKKNIAYSFVILGSSSNYVLSPIENEPTAAKYPLPPKVADFAITISCLI